MTVRRLADENIQPKQFSFNEENLLWAHQTIAKYPEGRQQSAVIPLLMRAQEQVGWVTRASIEYVADLLSMPYIRVLEIATFYTQFQLKPVGSKAHIQVCGTTPCMLRGAGDLISVCKKKINEEPFETNAEGTLSWEEVECLGACVNAPMVMVFKDTYEDLSPDRLAEIIDAFAAGEGDKVQVGSQLGRKSSEPITGLTTLLNEGAQGSLPTEARSKDEQSGGDSDVKPTNKARVDSETLSNAPAVKGPAEHSTNDEA